MMGPPWKCVECGVWWAGLEHRCQPTSTTTGAATVSAPVACTCPEPIDWSKTYIGDPPPCPVHNIPVTITYFVPQ